MIIRSKKILMIICTTLAFALMTGCWNYRELDAMALVAGVAIDECDNGSRYHLTIETLDTSVGGSGSDNNISQETTSTSKLMETEGNTIFDAVRNAVKESDKKLYWGDCKTVIISRQLACEGIGPVLDWINRDSEPRLTLDIFISKENTAEDVIKQKSISNQITSYAINKVDENDSKYLSKAPLMKLYQVNNVLSGEGEALFLPALDIDEKNMAPELDGTAVFKKDKLLGFLGSEESQYLLFIKGKVKGGLLLINENSEAPDISLEIKDSDTKISEIITDEGPKIKIQIKTVVDLAEIQTINDFDSDAGIQKVEEDASKTLENNIKQLIIKVQNEYDSDIFGFGNSIYQDYPDYWKTIRPIWGKLFKSLDVEVSADVQIKNTAEMNSNVRIGD